MIVAISLLAACNNKTQPLHTPSDIAPVQTATDAPETETTAPSTTLPPTTAATTAAPTTLKPTTTTAATTKAPVKPVTTLLITEAEEEKDAVLPTFLDRVFTDETVEETKLRYGVIVHKYETIYYQYLTDGTRHIVDEEISYTYNRSDYDADYDDLLPAAKANREKFREYIREVLRIINGYRAEGGVAPLKLNEEFTVMSCVRAEEIGWSGKFSHTRPNFTSGPDIFKEIGYKTGLAGENLARGYQTPEAVCAAWKESEVHYEVLMDPDFTETGIGVSEGPGPDSGGLFWSQHFYGPKE